MMMCDDELAFVDDAIGDGRVVAASNGAKDAGNVDAISDEGFLLRFLMWEQRSGQEPV